jgi:hypothetical protein
VILPTRIVAGIQIFEAQGTNRRHLGDLLAGPCPVEVGRIARQNDDATRRISFHLFAVEPIAQTDVENGLTDNDGEANRRWECREWLLVDVFRQNRSKNILTWLAFIRAASMWRCRWAACAGA